MRQTVDGSHWVRKASVGSAPPRRRPRGSEPVGLDTKAVTGCERSVGGSGHRAGAISRGRGFRPRMGRLQWLGREISPSLPAAPNFLHYFLRDPLVQGRRTHWTFRGLLDVHSRYGLPARCIAKATHVSRRLRRLRYLHRRSDSYRLERPSCRVGVAPTEDQYLSTAHTSFVPVSVPRPFPSLSLIGQMAFGKLRDNAVAEAPPYPDRWSGLDRDAKRRDE